MAELALNVNTREGRGKGYSNKLYAKGYMPAVFYGKAIGSIPIELEVRKLDAILKTKAGRNSIIDLHVKDNGNEETYKAMLKEIVSHPIKDLVLHADFIQISMKDKIQVTSTINLVGDSPGVAEGGTLEHLLWEVDIECLPGNIPDTINVNVEGLNFGDSITVADIETPEGVEILADADTLIARVAAPQAEETPEEAEEGEAAEAKEDAGAEEDA